MISARNHRPLLSGNRLLWLSLIIAVGAACSPKVRSSKTVNAGTDVAKTEKKEEAKSPEKSTGKSSKWLSDKPTISLILPFGADAINREQPAPNDLSRADLAIQFYRGFKLALDSVSADGYDLRLRVFDSNDEYNRLIALSRNAGLRTSDLIVGPVFPAGVKAFASFAQSVRRPVLSPLSASPPSEFNNPYLITLTVPLEMHARQAALFAMQKMKPMRVFILRSGNSEEFKYTRPFRQMVDSLSKKKISVTEIVVQNGDIQSILPKMTTQGNNLVVMPGTGRMYIDATLRSLDKIAHRYPINIIGHPSWEKLTYLNTTLLQRLQARITSSSRINYQSQLVVDFVREFRRDYKSEPNEYAFKGFDAGMYFGKMVAKNGSAFSDDLNKQDYEGLSNELIWQKTIYGWVNSHVYVLKYDNLQLKPEE